MVFLGNNEIKRIFTIIKQIGKAHVAHLGLWEIVKIFLDSIDS